MPTTETSEQKYQGNPSESGEISSGKIIDFFAAREALQSEARLVDEQAWLQQQINSATYQKRRIHLSDPWEDVMLLMLLVAAVVLGLLVMTSPRAAGRDQRAQACRMYLINLSSPRIGYLRSGQCCPAKRVGDYGRRRAFDIMRRNPRKYPILPIPLIDAAQLFDTG